MKYATVSLVWPDRRIHPVEAVFEREAFTVDAIRHVSRGPDGTYVELLELRGDLDRARTVLADSDAVVEVDVTGSDGDGIVYLQCLRVGLVDDLLATLQRHAIAVDWPMSYDAEERRLEVTVYGTPGAIQRAAASLPDGVRFELERIGDPSPDANGVGERLTARQRELLDLAVREGYYEVPRRTTHRELAAAADLSTGTVSEHLQRIEAKLVAAYTS